MIAKVIGKSGSGGYCSRVETERLGHSSQGVSEEWVAKSHWRDRIDRSWVTLEAGEAKMCQHLLVGEAEVLTDGFLMEPEEKEREEDDMSEQAYWMPAEVLKRPCFLLRCSSL